MEQFSLKGVFGKLRRCMSFVRAGMTFSSVSLFNVHKRRALRE
jgi:hypothetical protein